MVQVVERSDIFGKIGQSFGKGLGEVAQKETQRGLLRQDIGRLREGLKSGASPLDLASQLLTMRGIEPAQAMQLMPLFQQEMVREQAKQRQQPGVTVQPSAQAQTAAPATVPTQQPTTPITEQAQQQPVNIEEPTKITPQIPAGSLRTTPTEAQSFQHAFGVSPETIGTADGFKALIDDMTPPSPQQIDAIQDQLMTSGDARYYDSAVARQRATEIANQRVEAKRELANKYQRQTKAQEDFETFYDKEKARREVKNLSGEAQQKLIEAATADVLDGKVSPQKAAKDIGKIALSLDKRLTQLQKFGRPGGKPSDRFIRDITQYAKEFRKHGLQEEAYNTMLAKNGLGRRDASLVAWGLSNDNLDAARKSEGIQKDLVVKSLSPDSNKIDETLFRNRQQLSEEYANNVIPTIEPGVPIGALGGIALDKGLDEEVLYNRLREMSDQDPNFLTDVQKMELENITPVTESMDEVWQSAREWFHGKVDRKGLFEKVLETWGKQ